MFKKILVATDGSALSDKAAQAAMSFAAAQGASIVGLAVAEIYPFMLMPEAGAMVDLSLPMKSYKINRRSRQSSA